jgi:hypothetical protein
MHTEFLSKSLKGRDHMEELVIDYIIILKWNLKKECVRV